MGLKKTLLAMALWVAVVMALPVRAAALPPIKHVFVIVLENKAFSDSFGNNSPAPYLAHTLTAQGQLLANYWGVMHQSFGNYMAMVSGQAGNPQGQADCPFYTDFAPGTPTADGQVIGEGCVYPAHVKTIGDQLLAKGLSWKGYMEDMGNSPTESKTCRHPAPGAQDPHFTGVSKGDQYASRHNPFVYFHSIVDNAAVCNANDVPFDRLHGDLASASTTPNYSLIVPNFCNDGHDKNCVDGRPGGLVAVDAFLRQLVPRITNSPAYKQDGMLVVIFDEAPSPPGESTGFDATACPSPCQSPAGPNTVNPGGPLIGPGGGLVGGVVLSPWVRPGSINARPYNHYGLLRSIEFLFGLDPLGYAGLFGQTAFGADVFNGPGPSGHSSTSGGGASGCTERTLPKPKKGKFSRGTLILSAKKTQRGDRMRLEMRFSHRASVDISADPSGPRAPRRIGPTSVTSCKTYRTTLPRGSGWVAINAISSGGSELRRLHY